MNVALDHVAQSDHCYFMTNQLRHIEEANTLYCTDVELAERIVVLQMLAIVELGTETAVPLVAWPHRNSYLNRNLGQAVKTEPVRAAIDATLDWCWDVNLERIDEQREIARRIASGEHSWDRDDS